MAGPESNTFLGSALRHFIVSENKLFSYSYIGIERFLCDMYKYIFSVQRVVEFCKKAVIHGLLLFDYF